MPDLHFEGRTTAVRPGETVLDALIRDGHQVAHSCRAGACESCLLRADEGPALEHARGGLSEPRKALGYFLACQARPSEDLTIDRGGEGLGETRVRIAAVERLNATVIRVSLEPESDFDYRAGQFITLIRDDGLARSFSVTNLPGRDRAIELHVRIRPGGLMSEWLAGPSNPGGRASIRGPSGHCFYVPGREGQEIILAGTGTGLAPLYGIALDAIEHGHEAPVTLFHGARDPSGLYLDGPLRDLEARILGFHYVPCVVDATGVAPGRVAVGGLDSVLLDHVASFAGRRVFLCGGVETVRSLRKKVFLKGAAIKDIHSDVFVGSSVGPG